MTSTQRSHVRQTLRRATAAAHHTLDHHALLQRLTGSDLTRERYAQSLAAMHGAHARLEQRVLDSRHHVDSGLRLSARLMLLEADLRALGWPVPGVFNAPADPVEGRAAWWGRVYVLEGSRLGGAVISSRVRSSLGDAVPCRFFGEALQPDDHNAVLAMLERELEAPDELVQAVAGAQAAFAAYHVDLDAFDSGEQEVGMDGGKRG